MPANENTAVALPPKREILADEISQELRSMVDKIGNARVFEIEGKGHVLKYAGGFTTVGFDPSEFDGTDYLETIDKDGP